MKLSRINLLKNLLLVALIAATMVLSAGAAQAAYTIDYTIGNEQNTLVSYDPNGDKALHGSNLSVTGVTGQGTPSNNGVTLPITSGNLTFQTGALTSYSNNTWIFGTPGSFTLTGAIQSNPSTTLVSGHFTSASITAIDLQAGSFKFNIFGAGLEDFDNRSVYNYFGVPDSYTCTNALALTFTANIAGNGGFTSSTITSGTLVDSPTPTPIPAAAWLLGSGLMGLVGIRRRTGK